MGKRESVFFSVPYDLLPIGKKLKFDVYVNASKIKNRDNYVRIFPKGERLTEDDRKKFEGKYSSVCVLEEQRGHYLESLVASDGYKDNEKTEVVKNVAIGYLDNLFDKNKIFTTALMNESVEGCRGAVKGMMGIIKKHDIFSLQELIGELKFHDTYTYDHSINVAMYCIAIYRALKPDAREIELVTAGLSGMLHDIGKMKIPHDISNKTGKLEPYEIERLKEHPELGRDLVIKSNAACEGIDLKIISQVMMQHHENYDGTGFPNQLKGPDIHILSRILAVADLFDAITTKRNQERQMPVEEAIKLMYKTRGTRLDPRIFDLFVEKVIAIENFEIGDHRFELPKDFDPCHPHKKLPLIRDPGSISYATDKHGKVTVKS